MSGLVRTKLGSSTSRKWSERIRWQFESAGVRGEAEKGRSLRRRGELGFERAEQQRYGVRNDAACSQLRPNHETHARSRN